MSILAGGQYYPLWINTKTEEPFLRLKKHKNIIITPPKSSDAPELCTLLNHPLIQEWMDMSLPYHLGNVYEKLECDYANAPRRRRTGHRVS